MYCHYIGWCIGKCPLYRTRCPLFKVSFIRGSTVCVHYLEVPFFIPLLSQLCVRYLEAPLIYLCCRMIHPQNRVHEPIINPHGRYLVSFNLNGCRRKVTHPPSFPPSFNPFPQFSHPTLPFFPAILLSIPLLFNPLPSLSLFK